LDQPFVTGFVPAPVGQVPRVASELTWADRFGSFKARWNVGRMNYTVEPGLYALKNPNGQSPVLVTANYKMSFDRLRAALPGRRAWILALDTQGINVWCAAGKGTFGTVELVNRIESSGLSSLVSHRELLLPQLAGPGVAAHQVKKLSGFNVIYGPVRATDIPDFMDEAMKATPKMRRKTFHIGERAVLIPVELVSAMKGACVLILALFGLSGLLGKGDFWSSGMAHMVLILPAVLSAVLAGAVLTPLLLPWLPGRAFSLKGLPLGLAFSLLLLLFWWRNLATFAAWIELLAWTILIPAISTYLSLNFTGASTYTSLSGVKKEMRRAIPMQIGAGVLGCLLWLYSFFAV